MLRRDALVDGADAKEKRQVKGFNTRFMFQKKLEDLRNKIRAVHNVRCFKIFIKIFLHNRKKFFEFFCNRSVNILKK